MYPSCWVTYSRPSGPNFTCVGRFNPAAPWRTLLPNVTTLPGATFCDTSHARRGICSGVVDAEFVTASVAAYPPAAGGVKVALIVVDCPGASVTPLTLSKLSPKAAAPVPLRPALLRVIDGSPGLPRLVRTTACVAVPPVGTEPNV